MKKLAVFLFSVLVIFAGSLGVAEKVEALTFNLDYIIEWQTGGYKNTPVSTVFGIPSFGTITISDNLLDDVDIEVDLFGAGIHRIQEIDLNYDDNNFDSSTHDFGTLSSAGVKENENLITADGYPGYFDLQIPESGNLGTEPYTDTITLALFDLEPGNFNFTETLDFYLAAVHIGSFSGVPGVGGEDSIWVGASSTPVPEPATLLLLGSGLIGLAGIGRKKLLRSKK